MPPDRPNETDLPARGAFPPTRWSLISAVRNRDSHSERALASLCEAYWPPLYAYARRRGYPIDQAEDLTQGFFAQLLEKHYVAQADQERGRFRTFLLSSFKHYMANEWDHAQAQKRGGGRAILSMDVEAAEGRLSIEPADTMTPETLFVRQWARTLLDRVLGRLMETERAANPERFDCLKSCLMGSESSTRYRVLADELGTSEGAVKVAVHRLRKRFGQLLREEVAETVDGEEAVSEELRFLIEALGN